MNFVVKEGDYARMGAIQTTDNEVVFTFAGEKEDACCVVLIDKKTKQNFKIDVPDKYCLGSLRSIAVSGLKPEQYYYVYEINGEEQLDPYAHVIKGREIWNDGRRKEEGYRIYGSFRQDTFDWEEDRAPEIPKGEMLMYKLHVRGFSMDHGAGKKIAGTFRAVMDKIDYLKSLGVTTLELMPVYEFEEIEIPVKKELPDYIKWEPQEEDVILPEEPEEQTEKVNYWGYCEGNYFSVKASYASEPAKAPLEFKTLVKQLHSNGIECVMEMYFPGITNHNLILDALRFWVREYHVDGFHLLGEHLPITAIVQDVMLSRTKIFYTDFEPSVCFAHKKYKHLFVYKEEYQYPARKILNHLNGDMQEFVNQQKKQGPVLGYINFVSSNNGFTLADVFMYNDKHNEGNGEDNADGSCWNFSNNYGVEGPTRKRYITNTRKRMWKNAILMLFLAQGVPLIWSGDEMWNSQKGNNNAYCQDNPVGWLNWKNAKSHEKEIAFVRQVGQFRRNHPILSNEEPFHFSDYHSMGAPDVSYHGESAWISEFDPGRMSLGMMYCGAYSKDKEQNEDIYVAYNFYSAVTALALPKLPKKKKWYLFIDSAEEETPVLTEGVLCKNQQILSMKPQSICVLVGK